MGNNLTIFISVLFLDNDTSRVTNIGTKQLLPKSKHSDTSASTKLDVEYSREKLIVAVKESVIKGNADFVSV